MPPTMRQQLCVLSISSAVNRKPMTCRSKFFIAASVIRICIKRATNGEARVFRWCRVTRSSGAWWRAALPLADLTKAIGSEWVVWWILAVPVLIAGRISNSIAINRFLPTHPAPDAGKLIFRRRNLSGSLIGGLRETQEMLDFCAEHGIVSDIERIPIQQINVAYERMLKGDVKYRFVIDLASLQE